MLSPTALPALLGLLPSLLSTLVAPPQSEEVVERGPAEPVLVHWARSLEDAEAISHASDRPLLVCVNIDGEPASEYMVRRRYNDPDFARLTRSFVPLILSPDRHTPRDWDDAGRRIPCPRFGTIVCSEHIDAEPAIYERYFGGERVAPRHVAVATDGSVIFDLKWIEFRDLSQIEARLREIAREPLAPDYAVLLDQRTSTAHAALESTYQAAPPAERGMLLAAATEHAIPRPGLVRMGLAETDAALRDAALHLLAATADQGSEALLRTALQQAPSPELDALLVQRLRALPPSESVQRWLAERDALAAPSRWIQPEAWLQAARPSVAAPASEEEIYMRVDQLAEEARANPSAPEPELAAARAWLELGERKLAAGQNPSFFFMDARSAAERARDKRAPEATVAALLARAEWLLGNAEEASNAAESALPALPDAAPAEAARVLAIFANDRTRRVYDARGRNEAVPAELLSDAAAAYRLLLELEDGRPEDASAYADLLLYLDQQAEAERALQRALERYPASPELHQRFRSHVIAERGIAFLDAAYKARKPLEEVRATESWFHAYAMLVVAESAQRAKEPVSADSAYQRALRLFEESARLQPSFADSVNHYAALALSARARLALDGSDLESAAGLIVQSILQRPESAEWPDGLDRTPLDCLRRVRKALDNAGRAATLEMLRATIEPLVPEVWSKAGM